MIKLEQLIAELCPNGVPYKTFGEIGAITRGNGLQKSDFAESGVACIHCGQIYTYYGAFAHITK
jgi:type I restriction enzyme S subunit